MKKSLLFLSLSLIVISCQNDNDHKLSLSKESLRDGSERSQHEIKKLLLENTWLEVDVNIPLSMTIKQWPISENALNIEYNAKEDTYQLKVFKYQDNEKRIEILKGVYKMNPEGKFLLAEGNISDTRPKEIELKKMKEWAILVFRG